MKKYVNIADRLFIKIINEFGLIFENGMYKLPNINDPKCHLLEICLITDKAKMTGNKIKDIKSNLNVSEKWILGFFHASKREQPKFSNKDYLDGYKECIDTEEKNVQMHLLCKK
jgi:hypothetical protein